MNCGSVGSAERDLHCKEIWQSWKEPGLPYVTQGPPWIHQQMLLGLLSKRNPNWATCQLPSPTSLLASSLSPADYPSPVPLYLQLLQPCLTHSRCPRDGNRTRKWTLTNCSGGVLAFVWLFSPLQVHCTFHTRCVPQKLCVSWIFTGRNLFKMMNAVLFEIAHFRWRLCHHS